MTTEDRPEFEGIDLRRGRPERGSDVEAKLALDVFQYYRGQGLPLLPTDDKFVAQELSKVLHSENCFENNDITYSSVGLSLANAFHPEMLSVSCRGRPTPAQVFSDDKLFLKAITERIRYGDSLRSWGIRKCLSNLKDVQAVSNFRPTAARTICRLLGASKVLDFSMGFGGRMLGMFALASEYVGIDPWNAVVAGNRLLYERLTAVCPNAGTIVRLIQSPAEDVIGSGVCPDADLVFTSPPYFDVERYGGEGQSHSRYVTREKWLNGFLRGCIVGSKKELRAGGLLVINIGNELRNECCRVAVESGFRLVREWRLLLPARQYHKHERDYRSEPVLIFGKKGEDHFWPAVVSERRLAAMRRASIAYVQRQKGRAVAIGMKYCYQCHHPKPVAEFVVKNGKLTGRCSECLAKICQ